MFFPSLSVKFHFLSTKIVPFDTEQALFYQLWDINMDSGPVSTFQVHEYLRPKVNYPPHQSVM